MKKFLALTLVFMLCLSYLPSVAAFGTSPTTSDFYKDESKDIGDALGPTPPQPTGGLITGGDIFVEAAPEDSDSSLYVEPAWKLISDYNEDGEKIACAVNYLVPVSDDGAYEYVPGSWLLDQMLNKLDSMELAERQLELTAGSSGPVTAPAIVPYTGDEAGEPLYSAIFKLPSQDEGRTIPDDGTALVIKFPGNITITIPAQQAASVLSAIDLKVYSDRLTVDLVGAEDAEAYIDVPCTGTPVWIDAEGNEVESEYEETDGGYKVKVQSGLTLVFKA